MFTTEVITKLWQRATGGLERILNMTWKDMHMNIQAGEHFCGFIKYSVASLVHKSIFQERKKEMIEKKQWKLGIFLVRLVSRKLMYICIFWIPMYVFQIYQNYSCKHTHLHKSLHSCEQSKNKGNWERRKSIRGWELAQAGRLQEEDEWEWHSS